MKFFSEKKFNILLLLISASIALILYIYWHFVCIEGGCSYSFRNEFLRPLAQSSIFIGVISFFFLFLPAHYFTLWLKYILSWALPLSIVLVETMHSEGSWLVISKTDIVRLLGIVFGIVSVIFVLGVRFWYKR